MRVATQSNLCSVVLLVVKPLKNKSLSAFLRVQLEQLVKYLSTSTTKLAASDPGKMFKLYALLSMIKDCMRVVFVGSPLNDALDGGQYLTLLSQFLRSIIVEAGLSEVIPGEDIRKAI